MKVVNRISSDLVITYRGGSLWLEADGRYIYVHNHGNISDSVNSARALFASFYLGYTEAWTQRVWYAIDGPVTRIGARHAHAMVLTDELRRAVGEYFLPMSERDGLEELASIANSGEDRVTELVRAELLSEQTEHLVAYQGDTRPAP